MSISLWQRVLEAISASVESNLGAFQMSGSAKDSCSLFATAVHPLHRPCIMLRLPQQTAYTRIPPRSLGIHLIAGAHSDPIKYRTIKAGINNILLTDAHERLAH